MPSAKPKWAPRVPQRLIRRLYESDAAGLIDDGLLEDVGIRLYLRCESITMVQAIQHEGKLPCPICGRIIARSPRALHSNGLVQCDSCGWELPWQQYWATFRHQELAGAAFIEEFMSDWRLARTAKAKMLAIDRAIHRWHNEQGTKGAYGLGRPSGVNLIEGNREQVISFLDQLTFGTGLAASTGQHESWQANLARVRNEINSRDQR